MKLRHLVFILIILLGSLSLILQADPSEGFRASANFNMAPHVAQQEAQGNWETINDPTHTMNYTNPGGQVNYRNVVSTPASGSWTKIRVTFVAESAKNTDSLTASVCIRSGATDDCTATPTQVLFSEASSTYIATNSTVLSDEINFAFSSTNTLLVNVYTSNGEGRYSWIGGTASYDYAGADSTMTQNVSYDTDIHRWNYDLVEGWTTE